VEPVIIPHAEGTFQICRVDEVTNHRVAGTNHRLWKKKKSKIRIQEMAIPYSSSETANVQLLSNM
jgi:hypothetical protein